MTDDPRTERKPLLSGICPCSSPARTHDVSEHRSTATYGYPDTPPAEPAEPFPSWCPDCGHSANAHGDECTLPDCGCDRSLIDLPAWAYDEDFEDIQIGGAA